MTHGTGRAKRPSVLEDANIDQNQKPGWYSAAEASAIGIEIIVALGLGWYIGSRIDRRLHTVPWFTIFFVLLGVGAAIKAMVRVVRQYQKDTSDEGNDRR